MPADTPGVLTPAKSTLGPVTVIAWRDTDKSSHPPTYFLDLRMRGRPHHEVLGVSASRIKALADALLEVHAQLTSPKKP